MKTKPFSSEPLASPHQAEQQLDVPTNQHLHNAKIRDHNSRPGEKDDAGAVLIHRLPAMSAYIHHPLYGMPLSLELLSEPATPPPQTTLVVGTQTYDMIVRTPYADVSSGKCLKSQTIC